MLSTNPHAHLFYLVFLESWIIANVLANPDVDQADRDEILSLFILFRGVDHLHQVPDQLLDVLVPLLADKPGVVVARKEEEGIGAEKVKLPVSRRHDVDSQVVLHVHLGGSSWFWGKLVLVTKKS